MGQKITVVDAFTERSFGGNPAAVCLLETEHDERWMQAVAREMNLSETAFLVPGAEGFSLRWFTPTREVDLCGHATLGSAHVLWEEGVIGPETVARFDTRCGLLTAIRRAGWIEMDFPATPETAVAAPRNLPRALGAPVKYVGQTRFDFLVELEDEDTVRRLRPDMRQVKQFPQRAIIVTSKASSPDAEYDFVSRTFAPTFGIDEDPVTGSSHCALAPFWQEKLDKNELVGYQCSARGGTVRVKVAGERVILAGKAITMMRGELVGA